MRNRFWLALLLGFVAFPQAAQTPDALREQVRKAETQFAKAMADRDHAAFAAHVAEDAVFFGSASVQRGKAAVVAAWRPLFEGKQPPFSWAPEQVEVLASGGLAHSSGPVRDPAGKQIGTFSSIWRREPNGGWRVVFDKGCSVCDCPAAAP